MAAASPPPESEIKVYTPLPLDVQFGDNLQGHHTDRRWVHCLNIPTKKLNALQFSHRPYKWIRYATGVVLGAEGVLSTSPDSPTPVEDSIVTVLPAETSSLYYHISNEEEQRMFPVDPRIGRTRVTSSAGTSRRTDFRIQVARRDGNRCVLTRSIPRACQAVHLLSHSKGDTYISDFTRRRSRDPTRADIIEDIDSIRNGLFLNRIAQQLLGAELAFLRTPNFAMDTADVDPTAQPTERRCTAHLFEESYLQDPIAYHGSSGSFTIPDIPKHPPAILFDAVYAGAVLEYFGTGEFKDHLAATWNNTLCPDGVTSAAQADQQKLDDGRAIAAERSAAQDQERTTRADNRDNRLRPDPIDMIMAVSYSMMPPAKLQARIEDARVKAEAAERRHAHEKVDAWMRQVTDA